MRLLFFRIDVLNRLFSIRYGVYVVMFLFFIRRNFLDEYTMAGIGGKRCI